MFKTCLSTAHTPHSGHTQRSKKPSDADDRDPCEPAWTDLNLNDVVEDSICAFVIHQIADTFFFFSLLHQ